MPDPSEQFLTVRDLASRWGYTVQTIHVWNRTGRGPKSLRIGGELRYRLSDVLAWEESRERGAEVSA